MNKFREIVNFKADATRALAFLFMSFLLSCQSIPVPNPKMACSKLDWFECGRSDGLQGQNSTGWRERTNTCKNFTKIQKQAYISGWQVGANHFCSKTQGFALGKSGGSHENICPLPKRKGFLQAYQKGLKIFIYENENKNLSEQIELLENQANEELTKKNFGLRNQKLRQLRKKQDFNRRAISKIESEMARASSLSGYNSNL